MIRQDFEMMCRYYLGDWPAHTYGEIFCYIAPIARELMSTHIHSLFHPGAPRIPHRHELI